MRRGFHTINQDEQGVTTNVTFQIPQLGFLSSVLHVTLWSYQIKTLLWDYANMILLMAPDTYWCFYSHGHILFIDAVNVCIYVVSWYVNSNDFPYHWVYVGRLHPITSHASNSQLLMMSDT